jgi:hypothetical protein
MNNQKTVVAIGYHDLRANSTYILVRRHKDGHLVVNVVQITSKPAFDKRKSVTTFTAKGLTVNGRDLSDEDCELMELLTVNDIGCPRRGSPAGTQCRAFRYDEEVHQILLKDVLSSPDQWGVRFTYHKLGIDYNYFTGAPTTPKRKPLRQTTTWGLGY